MISYYVERYPDMHILHPTTKGKRREQSHVSPNCTRKQLQSWLAVVMLVLHWKMRVLSLLLVSFRRQAVFLSLRDIFADKERLFVCDFVTRYSSTCTDVMGEKEVDEIL